MKKESLVYIILFLFVASGFAQDKRFPEPLSPRTSNYDIKLFLDTDKKQVTATQTLTFKNPSSDTIWTMPFHMYYNAFKNNKSNFNTGASGIPRTIPKEDIEKGLWGWTDVREVMDENGDTLSFAYIQPDNDNKDDHTVLEVRLKEPVLPNATYVLDMKWQSQIPKAKPRTGYNKDFYFMAQWYPKLGVYEPAGSRFAKEGAWNCHQYHPNTEYFGEFGVYQVEIDVPKEYKTGGSGFVLSEQENGDRKKVTYLAEDVIDFAWTANPNFIEIAEEWKGVNIKLLIMPEHTCNKERFLKAAKNTLEFYEEYIEKYPYPSLTIVSPPFHGLFSGAMEYPTLITSPTLCDLPESIKTTETLTIHELSHQYFMQMLSSNEQEEPWLDEGFTSFFEAKILDKYYPEGIVNFDYFDIKVGSMELRRGRFLSSSNPKVSPLSELGYLSTQPSYRDIVYSKVAVGLSTLEGLVGEDVMRDIIKAYFARWKFKHPCRHDFEDVVAEVIAKQGNEQLSETVAEFMRQFIYGTDECDYTVHSVSNTLIPPPLGFFDDLEDCQYPPETTPDTYISKVTLYRLGEFIVPQEVRILFDNGNEILETWDGKARSHEFIYRGKQQVTSVEIDPAHKIQLDNNLINNSYTKEQDTSGVMRWVVSFMTWMEGAMVSVSGLI